MDKRQTKECRARLEAFLSEILVDIGRRERQHWATVYVRGLLLDGERKSVGAMARRLPDGNEQNLQQFVNQSPWRWQRIWQNLALKLENAFPPRVWVIDDTGFPKQGEHSVAVHRQYSGTLGKKSNCQVAVSLHAAGVAGSSPIGWRLYLPKVWANDLERRRGAGIPDDVIFRRKWELALELIDVAVKWGLPPRPILADAGYGDATEFRQGLESRGLSYAVAVQRQVTVWKSMPQCVRHERRVMGRPPRREYVYNSRPATVRAIAHEHRWRFRTVSWREGSKGPMQSRFFRCRVQPANGYQEGRAPGKQIWLLVEWRKGEPEPRKYLLCDLPANLSLRKLVGIAFERWRIEQDYQQLKEELGLDHFEGRSWGGWHRHVTMVMLAHAFLRFERWRSGKFVQPTLPQMRREIQKLLSIWTGVCCYCGNTAQPNYARSP